MPIENRDLQAGTRLVARHKGMWRYYKHHVSSNAVVDALVAAGIAGRCALAVANSWLRRKLQEQRG